MNQIFELQAVDHIEFATRDLSVTEPLFHRLGFKTLKTRTLAERSLQSKLLGQNDIFIILSQSNDPNDPLSQFVRDHGDGVFAVTLKTNDCVSALEWAQARGAIAVVSPKTVQKDSGSVTTASVRGIGSTQIQFLSREGSLFSEGFEFALRESFPGFGLTHFDHFSIVVPSGHLKTYEDFLTSVLGMEKKNYNNSTPHKVFLKYRNFHIVLNEPDSPDSDLAKFIEGHHGAGFDHIAFGSKDLSTTLEQIQRSQVPFRTPSPSYYQDLAGTRPDLKDQMGKISKLNMVIHGSPDSQISQAATQFIHGFWYFEFVERHHFEELGTDAQKILIPQN